MNRFIRTILIICTLIIIIAPLADDISGDGDQPGPNVSKVIE